MNRLEKLFFVFAVSTERLTRSILSILFKHKTFLKVALRRQSHSSHHVKAQAG